MDTNLTQEIDKFYESYHGAEDLRTQEEKNRDWNQSEFVASANPINWVEKKEQDWRSFPVLNQFFTYKCVAFTTAKLALINYWLKTKELLKFSPNTIYDYRSNKPGGGMVGYEAFKIWQDKGISLDAVCHSDQLQESIPFEISLFAKEVAKGFKLGNHITIDNGDFDRVASTIQTTGKGVMVWFYFTHREWSQTYPQVMDNLPNPYVDAASRHSVTAVDFGMINGKQYIKIEDSAHFGGLNVRYISREFFTARNYLIKYPMNFNYEDPQPLPPTTPKLTKNLKKGMKDPEVKVLQQILRTKGYFPSNVDFSETFGNVTETSVKAFQTASKLLVDGVVGPKTRELLNK